MLFFQPVKSTQLFHTSFFETTLLSLVGHLIRWNGHSICLIYLFIMFVLKIVSIAL
jgi:hypothetical protein